MHLFAAFLVPSSCYSIHTAITLSPSPAVTISLPRFSLHPTFRQLFPIRLLKEVTSGCTSGSITLERLGMVDCQRRDRIGPAAGLLEHAKRISVIDHHADKESDVGEEKEEQKVGNASI